MDKLARKVDIHHAAMQGSYFAGFSAIWGFGPVLLLYLGLSNSTLGVVTSLALVLPLLLQPALAALSDADSRWTSRRLALVLSLLTLAAAVLLGEKLSVKKGICILAALCGMILISGVIGGGIPEARELTGIGLGLGAACFYACVILCNKKLKDIGAYDKTIVQLLAAALVMVPYCVLTGERFTAETFQPVSLACLLVLGMFHTGFAYALYFGSMKALRAQTIAIFSYIDPVIAILLSVTVLHEPFSILSAVGSVLILGAAFVSEKT